MHKLRRILWLWLGLASGSWTIAHGQPFDPAPEALRVMSWNVEWMFDDDLQDNDSPLAREQSAPSTEYWNSKLSGVASVIAQAQPDILALQEIEGRQTLSDLVRELKDTHRLSYRYAFIEGNDSFTEQDVGVLYSSGLVAYGRREQSRAMFNSQEFYNLSKHILAEFRWEGVTSPLVVLNVHLRATAEAEGLRVRQTRLISRWLSPNLTAGQDVIVLGDFNAEGPATPANSGAASPELAVLLGAGEPPMMHDLLAQLTTTPPPTTHLILDKQFDRILASHSLMVDEPGTDWSLQSVEVWRQGVIRGAADGAGHWDKRLKLPTDDLDLSDHFPVVAVFVLR